MVDIAGLKLKIDCIALAEKLGIKGRRGRGLQVSCWNKAGHANGDRHPSMTIYPDGFKCNGCGIHGDCIELYQQLKGVDFKEAVAALAQMAGVTLDSTPSAYPTKQSEDNRAPRVSEPRASFYRSLWGILEGHPLDTAASITWLHSRNIRPQVAYDLGCRDWSTARADIGDLVAKYTIGQLQDFGLGWRWRSLLEGNRRFDGLAIPVWVQPHPFPVAYRWRYYAPGEVTDEAKVLGMLGQCQAPLGVRAPATTYNYIFGADEPQDQRFVDLANAKVVFIVEGEPDWLSLSQEAPKGAVVLGLTPSWRSEWKAWVPNGALVHIVLHDTQNAELLALKIAQNLGPSRCKAALVPESEDLNDVLKASNSLAEVFNEAA